MPPDHDALLAELVREAERSLDHQLRIMGEQDDKTEQALALAVASLGGGLALATVTARGNDALAVGILALGGLFNLAALWWLLDAYVGVRHAFGARIGPHPASLWETAVRPDARLALHLVAMLESLARYADLNLEAIRAVALRRHTGLRLMACALTAYAGGVLYVLSRGLHG